MKGRQKQGVIDDSSAHLCCLIWLRLRLAHSVWELVLISDIYFLIYPIITFNLWLTFSGK